MKKTLAFILALTLMLTLASCDKGNSPDTQALTPAASLLKEFKEKAGSADLSTAEKMAESMASSEILPFSAVSAPVTEGYLSGFKGEITGFSQGASFAPLIGSIPFVGYIFTLESKADAADFVKTLKKNADLRWNVCTQADELVCEAVGKTVFFVMSPAEFEE